VRLTSAFLGLTAYRHVETACHCHRRTDRQRPV